MRAAILTLALVLVACDNSPTKLTVPSKQVEPEKIGELGDKGFALFECAAFASFGEYYKPKTGPLFKKGYEHIVKFIAEAKELRDNEKAAKVATNKVPILVLDNLGGPSPDFMAGRIWSATELAVEDQLYDRSSWTHQKNKPDQPDLMPELIKAQAEETYRQKNCDLLLAS